MLPRRSFTVTDSTVPAQAAQTSVPSAAAMSRPSWVRQSARVSLYCRASAEKAATVSPVRGGTMIRGADAMTGSAGSSVSPETGTSGFSGRTGMVTGTETSSASSPLGSVWSAMMLGVSRAWGSLVLFARVLW